MSVSKITDFNKLCLHTITTKQWDIETIIDKYSAAGIKGVSIWRQWLEGRDPQKIKNMMADNDLTTVSLVRGGFFPAIDKAGRQAAIDENKKCVDEAAAVGAPMIVLVCGAVPGMSLTEARQQIKDGIQAVLPYAKDAGVKLAIEPLHPMYAGDRSAVNTMKQANDMCDAIDDTHIGVAVDVYHVWWDSELQQEIKRCGESGNLFAFHICDWRTPTVDMLNDRGLMGEGCINIPEIRGWVEETGFNGFNEVEIFSNRWWQADPDEFLKAIQDAYLQHS